MLLKKSKAVFLLPEGFYLQAAREVFIFNEIDCSDDVGEYLRALHVFLELRCET